MNKKRERVPKSKIKVGGRKMKVDKLTKVLTTLSGKSMKDGDNKNLTLKTVIVKALLAQTPEDRNLSGVEKIKRYKFAMRVYDAKDVIDITAKQVELIKEQIARIYTPLIVGQAWPMIEPGASDDEEEEEEPEEK